MRIIKSIYSNLRKIVKLFDFDFAIVRIDKNRDFEKVIPYATYSPWLSDKNFNRIFNIIKNHTMVDKYRCYELWQLVTESKKLNGSLIDVGVWRGGTGALIAKSAEFNNIKDTIYLCDTFTGVVKVGNKDPCYKDGEHADTSQEIVEDLIFKKLKLKNTKILRGIFPDDTGKFVNEDKFRFCHIDVDVYQSAKDIINWVWPRMVVGGIIVFDDYGFAGSGGITKFVNEERRKNDRLVIHNLNGHAIVIKIK